MRNLDDFKNDAIQLDRSVGGVMASECCVRDYDSTYYFNSPTDAGDDDTITYYDESGREVDFQFVDGSGTGC